MTNMIDWLGGITIQFAELKINIMTLYRQNDSKYLSIHATCLILASTVIVAFHSWDSLNVIFREVVQSVKWYQ